MQSPHRAYLWMLSGAASFSVMSFLTHTLHETYSWELIAVVRTGVALILTVVLALSMRAQLVLWRPRTLWVRSFAGSVALLANFYAMTHYPISEVLALSNMFPLWVAVLSWPVLGEPPRLDAFIAAAFGVSGVFVLQQSASGVDAHAPTDSVVPVVAAVVASFASAIAMLGLHRLKGIDERAIVAHFSGVSLTFTLIALAVMPEKTAPHGFSTASIAPLLGLGIAATAGQLFLTRAFASGPPTQVSVVGLTQIGFSMILERVFEQRQFSAMTLFGLALVVAPTAWVMTRRRTKYEVLEEDAIEPMSDV
jgi:drug/metabolite transporter (DMT)-like permease